MLLVGYPPALRHEHENWGPQGSWHSSSLVKSIILSSLSSFVVVDVEFRFCILPTSGVAAVASQAVSWGKLLFPSKSPLAPTPTMRTEIPDPHSQQTQSESWRQSLVGWRWGLYQPLMLSMTLKPENHSSEPFKVWAAYSPWLLRIHL